MSRTPISRTPISRTLRVRRRGLLPSTTPLEKGDSPRFECPCNAEPQDMLFCYECKQINFDEYLSRKTLWESPKAIHSLEHIFNIWSENCPLCKFFRNCAGAKASIFTRVLNLTLRYVSKPFHSGTLRNVPVLEMSAKMLTEFGVMVFCPIPHSQVILPGYYQPGIPAQHINRDKINTGLLKSWLGICSELHHPCKTGNKDHVPGMYIIDCGTRLVIPFPVENIEYVALSYVWGAPHQQTTTLKPENLSKVPKVIDDAMLLVLNLGFRYLWVDRYCIPQDDENSRFIQIQNMGKIYTNATLTVIAAAGEDPDYGLPGVSSTPRSREVPVRVGRSCLVAIHWANDEISKTKWSSRGWTYQEALLSNRRLVFTDSQVYFQCQSMHCTDNYPIDFLALHSERLTGMEPIVFPLPMKLQDQCTVSERITEFLDRDLSIDSDALNAITGVLRMYRELPDPVNFFCGLPIFSLASCDIVNANSMTDILAAALLWNPSENLVRRPGFPSWSWAGWKRLQNQNSTGLFVEKYNFMEYSEADRENYLSIVVEMEFSDTLTLKWEDHFRHILEMSDAANYPRCLWISGWTLQAHITYTTNYYRGPCWKVKFPGLGNYASITLGDIGLSKDKTHKILGLLLSYEDYGYCDLLYLRQSQDGSSFERISCGKTRKNHAATFNSFEVNLSKSRTPHGEPIYTWKKICLT